MGLKWEFISSYRIIVKMVTWLWTGHSVIVVLGKTWFFHPDMSWTAPKMYENAFGHNKYHMSLKWDFIYSYRIIVKMITWLCTGHSVIVVLGKNWFFHLDMLWTAPKMYENALNHNGEHMGLKWDFIYNNRIIVKMTRYVSTANRIGLISCKIPFFHLGTSWKAP